MPNHTIDERSERELEWIFNPSAPLNEEALDRFTEDAARERIQMKSAELISLLTVDAVLLPVKSKTKHPPLKQWQNTTYEDTQEEAYQQKLESHGNTGILLGEASEHLCSIDFDDDEALTDFLKNNSSLRVTLQTTAKRGANLWVIINGDYPRSEQLKDRLGKPIGEWRANGNQTIIQGIHPEGNSYNIKVNRPPVRINYSDLNWGNIIPPRLCHIDDTDHTDDIEYTEIQSIQTNNKGGEETTLIEKENRAEKALTKLKSNPSLWKLYQQYIQHKFTPQQGERNNQLVSMVTFLAQAVSRQRVIELTKAFYEVNQDVFADSLDQHVAEAEAHLKATLDRWEEGLTLADRTHLKSIPALQCEAYRICRDLAQHDNDKCSRGSFFLSCDDLARRLDTDIKKAHRIFAQFESLGILSITLKGTRHSKGSRGKATTYKWLPITKQPK